MTIVGPKGESVSAHGVYARARARRGKERNKSLFFPAKVIFLPKSLYRLAILVYNTKCNPSECLDFGGTPHGKRRKGIITDYELYSFFHPIRIQKFLVYSPSLCPSGCHSLGNGARRGDAEVLYRLFLGQSLVHFLDADFQYFFHL